jgi:hypothetical protein
MYVLVLYVGQIEIHQTAVLKKEKEREGRKREEKRRKRYSS